MKFHHTSFFLIFSIFVTSALFTAEHAERMTPHASRLFTYAEKGQWDNLHIELCNKYLPKRIDDTDCINEKGYTLLHYAVENNQGPIVVLLLAMGATVNTSTVYENKGHIVAVPTPLHLASKMGYKDIAEKLLEKDPHSIHSTHCEYNNTPLHVSAWFGKEDMVTFLLEKGARITAQNNQGSTAMHLSVFAIQPGCLTALLAHPGHATLKSATTANLKSHSPLCFVERIKGTYTAEHDASEQQKIAAMEKALTSFLEQNR